MPVEVPAVISPFAIGQRVCIAGVKPGILKYYGKTQFAEGDWCGIELDEKDGKHNGTVSGIEYFESKQGHGIFAPVEKVEAYIERASRLQQPKASGLKRLSKSRSKSPEPSSSSEGKPTKEVSEAASSEGAAYIQSPKFISKLLKPKAKSYSSQLDSDSVEGKPPSGHGTRESSVEPTSEKPPAQRPSRLPKQSSGLPVKRSHSALEPADVKKYHSSIPKPGGKKELSETTSLGDLKHARLEERKSIPRAERQVKTRSLSYDLTSTDGHLPFPLGLDPKQKDTALRSSSSSLCSKSSTGSIHSPIPDLLTPSALLGKRTPVGFGGEAMSEPEDDSDFLAASSISHASSLGILPDTVICDNSLVAGDFTAAGMQPKTQSDETESKETTEMMEKDLDNEISGISTPEIDMSSSTISGKDLCSSPDMDDGTKSREFEMEGQKVSSPSEKGEEPMAGEMLATPATTSSSESSPDSDATKISNSQAVTPVVVDSKPPPGPVVKRDKRPSRDSSVDSTTGGSDSRPGSKRGSVHLLEEYPSGIRTSMDLDEVDGSCSMSASVEIAKTAVQQYADLMAAAEKERQASFRHREAMAARRAARRSSAGERARSVDSDGSDCEFILQRSASSSAVDITSATEGEQDQLMVDLQAGHTKQDRPVSMISTGSADTGIVADLPGTPNRKERPLSLVSTTSVDTGYQPDTDSEVGGTLTTNSPLEENDDSPTLLKPGEELSPRSAALSLDAAYKETLLKFQQATPKGMGQHVDLLSDSDLYSDTGTLMGDSEQEATDIDDLMVQQDLLESGLERLRDAMPGMSLPTGGRGSPTNFGDDQDTPGSSTEEEDMALHEGQQTPLSDIHVHMETIPEQDTPESPDVDLATVLQSKLLRTESPDTTSADDLTASTEPASPIEAQISECLPSNMEEQKAEAASPKDLAETDLKSSDVSSNVMATDEEDGLDKVDNKDSKTDLPEQSEDNKASYESVMDVGEVKKEEELRVDLEGTPSLVTDEKSDLQKPECESVETEISKEEDKSISSDELFDNKKLEAEAEHDMLVQKLKTEEEFELKENQKQSEASKLNEELNIQLAQDDNTGSNSVSQFDMQESVQSDIMFASLKTSIKEKSESEPQEQEFKAVPEMVISEEQKDITDVEISQPSEASEEIQTLPHEPEIQPAEPAPIAIDSKPEEEPIPEVKQAKLSMSEAMANVQDAPISSSQDTISTTGMTDTMMDEEALPEEPSKEKGELVLETMSRSCVQGLPPPVEPDPMTPEEAMTPGSPDEEVNKNVEGAWTQGHPQVSVTVTEEPTVNSEMDVGENGIKRPGEEGESQEQAVVEEFIVPEQAKEECSSVPLMHDEGQARHDLICIRDAIPADAIGASAEDLTELAVEELILPSTATKVESSVPQFSSNLTELAVEELILPSTATKVESSVPQFLSKPLEEQISPVPIEVLKPAVSRELEPDQHDLNASSSSIEQEITEKEKASVDDDKEIVKETTEEMPVDQGQEIPVALEETVKPEGQSVPSHIESVTEHDILVETLEVTEGPILRTSTPVSDFLEDHHLVSSEEEPLPETHSANTTFTEGDTIPLVEIEIVSAEMSESTMKDEGPGEKGIKDKDEETTVEEKKIVKKNGSKVTKSKRIEDVAKADQKKTLKTTRSTLKDTKSKGMTTAKTSAKDNEKTTLKNKATKPNTTKTTTLKKTETDKKPTPAKVGSRIGNYIKDPPKPKTKEENTAVVSNVKTVKNNSNLKKVDSGAGGDRKNPSTIQKRNPPPKSKWGNIMSQIDSGKSNKTSSTTTMPAPKATTKVDPKKATSKALNTSSSSIGRPTTPRGGSGTTTPRAGSAATIPRNGSTNPRTGSATTTSRSTRDATASRSATSTVRRTSSANAADAKTRAGTSVSATSIRAGRPSSTSGVAGRAKSSPDTTARPDSRMSNASETSALNTSRNGSLPGSRPTSASKPENRKTANLRRERSPSVGSEASGSSQVSSHGSRSPRTKEPTPEPSRPKPGSAVKRRSLAEPSVTRAGTTGKVEPRRSSLATSSRLATKKEGSPTSTTDKKASMLPSLEDQNRNKTSKSTSASSSLKRSTSNQPDVVTNSVAPTSGAAEEIARLEALCETRTKQLNIARMQLRASAQGFDAMTVLVRYLNEELDAFSCPDVTAKLKAVKAQLAEAQQQIDVLAADKASLEKSLSDLKDQHAAEVTKVKEEHQEEMKQLQERLHMEKEQEIEKVVEKYSLEVTTLKSFLEKNIEDMKSKHEKTLKDHEQKHSDDVDQLKKEHDGRAKDLQKQHERRMEEITRTFENIKVTLSEKVETLRGECEEMRNREAHLEERTQREADMKIHLALAKYQHLPAEIESLKAVMEMRNQELHELRHKKLDLEKQMEEIPKAREKIISLQQKVENLEAVIQIKADYEKQLAEKHQILLRKFDKEYKANKRLSMDNEELAWRLANSADSPDLLRRSVSHSPTRASAEPTPEVVRRRKSPACSIPTSPRNQTEFDRSPTMLNSPPKSNLKRSGTYDLLHKDLDEKEGMKQSDV